MGPYWAIKGFTDVNIRDCDPCTILSPLPSATIVRWLHTVSGSSKVVYMVLMIPTSPAADRTPVYITSMPELEMTEGYIRRLVRARERRGTREEDSSSDPHKVTGPTALSLINV